MIILPFQSYTHHLGMLKRERYIIFFKILDNLGFIAVGDYNIKHMHWRSKFILSKKREILKAIEAWHSCE